jgi:hypothetical protein
MKNKAMYGGGVLVAILAFVGIATAAGVGPTLADLKEFIKGPVDSPSVSIDATTGCDQAATSSDCGAIKRIDQQAPELSTASTYPEVASTQQSGRIDEHLTVNNDLKGVSFCETSFKTRQIMINGVDVGQRIAQLASSDAMGKGANESSIGKGVCNSMPHNVAMTKGILEMRDVTTFQTEDERAVGNNYRVYLGDLAFAVNATTNEIFLISAYDGSTLTSVGKLK